jgi:hypothetical protein
MPRRKATVAAGLDRAELAMDGEETVKMVRWWAERLRECGFAAYACRAEQAADLAAVALEDLRRGGGGS